MALTDRLQLISNSLVGGNIVSVLTRQAIRLNALGSAAAFAARKSQLYTQAQTYIPPAIFIAGIPVSARLQEVYTFQSDITRHPVESGAPVTDHVILQPIRIDLSFEISNWRKGDAEYALSLFELMWQQRVLVELLTEHKKIPDMVLIHFEGGNSAPIWGRLGCRATFQQVKLIELETTPYPKDKVTPTDNTGGTDVSKSIESPVNTGQQTPQDKSGLLNLLDLFK